MNKVLTPGRRNLAVWLGTGMILGAVWLLAVRPRQHFIDPTQFLLILAAAAAALTALLWWETAGAAGDAPAAAADFQSDSPTTSPSSFDGDKP